MEEALGQEAMEERGKESLKVPGENWGSPGGSAQGAGRLRAPSSVRMPLCV